MGISYLLERWYIPNISSIRGMVTTIRVLHHLLRHPLLSVQLLPLQLGH
jgi:hypothetical protein